MYLCGVEIAHFLSKVEKAISMSNSDGTSGVYIKSCLDAGTLFYGKYLLSNTPIPGSPVDHMPLATLQAEVKEAR